MPASLRKAPETASLFFPALVKMLMEVETNQESWSTCEQDSEMVNSDPATTAMSSISRLANDLGEKTMMVCSQNVILECISQPTWEARQAGYTLLGLISTSCKDALSKNMEKIMEIACRGVVDPEVRVRYAGLSAVGMLFTELAPKVQLKFHGEIVPVLTNLMLNEDLLKMQTQATSAMLNFVNGLIPTDEQAEDNETEEVDHKQLMSKYNKNLLQTLFTLLKKGIQAKHEPLQTEVLNVLSAVCNVIIEDFAEYYNDFMPLMVEIL